MAIQNRPRQSFKWVKQLTAFIIICTATIITANAFANATATPSDPQALRSTKAVQAYLAALTNGSAQGVIAGQNIGHSDDISNTTGLSGFIPLIGELEKQTGEVPGIVGVDYEHNQIATPEQLHKVNLYLIEYWNKGGLISINWSPQNPWWNDESNIEKNLGSGATHAAMAVI